MKNSCLFIGLMLIISCCIAPTKAILELTQIDIDPDKVENYIDISPMLSDSIDIIPLETNDECLLSNIDRLIFHDGHYYVLDDIRKYVFVFDDKGHFVRKIGKPGGGPGEYSSILFFDIMGDSIFVSSRLGFKSLIYNLTTGELMRELSHKISQVDGFSLDGSAYLINNYGKVGQENFNLCKLDLSTGKIVDKFMPFDDNQAKFGGFGLANYTCSYKDSAYVILPYNDTIYQVTKVGVAPMYEIHFTTRTLPDDMHPTDGKSWEKVLRAGYVRGLGSMQISKDYILGFYFDKQSIRNVCIDRHTLDAKVTDCFTVKKLGHLPLSQFYVCNENLISVIPSSSLEVSLNAILTSPYSTIEAKYRGRLKELQKNLKDDSNPVLFRYRLKEVD